MRSYGQYCGLARALDVVGERWSLLIVRELLDGPRRYNELLRGLPGIATNLLAERLRSLEARRRDPSARRRSVRADPMGRGPPRGDLCLRSLGRTAHGPTQGEDHFRPNWIRHMVVARFEGIDPLRKELSVELRFDDEPPVTLISARGQVHLAQGATTNPDVTLAGPHEAAVGLLLGRISRAKAESAESPPRAGFVH